MNFKDEIQDLIEKSGMGLTGGFNGKTKVSMDDLDTDIQDLITKSKVVELRLPDAFKNARQYIAAPNPIFFKVLDDLLVGNNVYLVGEAGTGKTYLAEKAAQALKREYTTINCNQWTSPREIIGGETISGAKDGKLIEAWRDGKILILDELPKLDPNTAGMINEALAKSDKTGVDSEITTFDGKKIRKHPNFACIATGNTTGKTVSPRYGGNNRQDYSLIDRFSSCYYMIDFDRNVEISNVFTRVFNICDAIRDILIAEEADEILTLRTMLQMNRIYHIEMERELDNLTPVENGKTLRDSIESYLVVMDVDLANLIRERVDLRSFYNSYRDRDMYKKDLNDFKTGVARKAPTK